MPSKPAASQKWLTTPEVSALTGISVSVLRKWRHRGIGPRYLKLGTSANSPVRYRPDDIEAWAAAQEKKTAA